MQVQFPDENVSAQEVAAFYSDLLNQLTLCDRALIGVFLASPGITDEQRTAIATWGESVEAIVETAMARHFETGMLPQ
ncbi:MULTISPECIES: hypothetical protein [unclassified Agrobacterium]|uniref:hypothetical protein n=1 Tax=unclassified Agrobacterium TaxID=2632611 RepID=UPI0024483136|nr:MULTISPECIES: hypothetical protein [unclassified Agrobacterium]MDH0615158.1 hypothetical protein [Agrobacterium sp. GD03872]MDH0698205.1 hypothetical protein [Agrobacterium sp. GD03871]MDH1060231.1 hypothetical protein [Agrobacterium sp. GD03992]MDH2211987.1 hypothetical protein [Agrobacterium sp. GD03643]MDH2220300.1 hypothetical protein [Agrobacterium sp. GD03638]